MKYKRLFTFGCSFANWSYPTWADMLIQEFKSRGLEGYNFGCAGAGNLYIFTKLMEANQVFKFNNEDLILISWTSMQREDRYAKGEWHTPGNVYNQSVYSDEFVKEWADLKFYHLRDSALISAARKSFEHTVGGFYTTAMSSFSIKEPINPNELDESCNRIINAYSENIKLDFTPFIQYLKFDYNSEDQEAARPNVMFSSTHPRGVHKEWHPFPEEYYRYINKEMLPVLGFKLSVKTLEYIKYWSSIVNIDNGVIDYSKLEFNQFENSNNLSKIYGEHGDK